MNMFALLLPLLVSAPDVAPPVPGAPAYVWASRANLRDAPGATATLVVKMAIGTGVHVENCGPDYCQVTARTKRGVFSGHVGKSLLSSKPPRFVDLVRRSVTWMERSCAMRPQDESCLNALASAHRAAGDSKTADKILKNMTEQASVPSVAPVKGEVLLATSYHGDEVSWPTGVSVTALCDGALKQLRASVDAVADPIVDSDEGPPTGKRVTVPCDASFVMRGVAGLAPGPIEKGTWTGSLPSIQVRFKKTSGMIRLDPKTRDLYSELDGRRNALVKGPVDSESVSVLFVGDLNRDGFPDLLISGSAHYNVSVLHLFLSNSSGDLQRVASHRSVGC